MTVFIGIDVADRRGCAVAALDQQAGAMGVRWCDAAPRAVVDAIGKLAGRDAGAIVVGIDAPRQPLARPRTQYWSRARASWRSAGPNDRGHGRHCEVVIAALGLARPQWTPLARAAPAWMRRGFALFAALATRGRVHEVFPSASYAQLNEADEPRLTLPLAGFARGPKDALDAYVAALTVREYHAGRGTAVGGGDGLGTIVLPRPVTGPPALLTWGGVPHAEN